MKYFPFTLRLLICQGVLLVGCPASLRIVRQMSDADARIYSLDRAREMVSTTSWGRVGGACFPGKRRNVGVLNCLLPEKHVINYHALIVVMPGAHNPGNAPNF